jgi:ketosteroid isomerase-like protein
MTETSRTGDARIHAALETILAAFNAHDLDRIMSLCTDDVVLEMPRGPEPWGRRFSGKAAVREGLAGRFAGLPDVHYANATHVVSGEMGISRWTISGTTPAGQRIRANGCDFYRFRDGLIAHKDSYWKIVE